MTTAATNPFSNTRPVLSVAEMTRADREAAHHGRTGAMLMEAAGWAVATEILRRFPRRPVCVLRGPGNNGGDGSVVARLLHRRGWPVRVLEPAAPATADAALMARRWTGAVAPLTAEALKPEELVVDALFGAGLSRDVDDTARAVIERLRDMAADCVAVDLPSGVNGDTGRICGEAVKALLTVTFFQPKPAHLLYPGRKLCGDIVVADIGIPPAVLADIRPAVHVNAPGLWRLTRPYAMDHKYTRGHAVVVAGPRLTGAARLAARGARRIGAGLVTLAGPPEVLGILNADAPGALVHPLTRERPMDALLTDTRHNAFLLGPGRGRCTATAAEALCLAASDRAVVLDADALSSLEGRAEDLSRAVCGPCVLTPHEGEFARLFEGVPEVLEIPCRLERARMAARLIGAVMVLKGPDTVIAAPDGTAAINADAPPTLATAGTGDVLSGLIVGLLAKGMAPFEAACAGVWIHGAAAARIGPGLIAEDLPDAIPAVLADLFRRQTLGGRREKE